METEVDTEQLMAAREYLRERIASKPRGVTRRHHELFCYGLKKWGSEWRNAVRTARAMLAEEERRKEAALESVLPPASEESKAFGVWSFS
jgi:hypothetical protein